MGRGQVTWGVVDHGKEFRFILIKWKGIGEF